MLHSKDRLFAFFRDNRHSCDRSSSISREHLFIFIVSGLDFDIHVIYLMKNSIFSFDLNNFPIIKTLNINLRRFTLRVNCLWVLVRQQSLMNLILFFITDFKLQETTLSF